MNKKTLSIILVVTLIVSTFAVLSELVGTVKALTTTTTTISTYSNYVTFCTNSVITFSVNVTATDGTKPTGSVTWTTNSSTGTFTPSTGITTLNSAGTGSITYVDTTPGNITITATYGADSTHSGSSQTINISLYNLDFNHDNTVNFEDVTAFVIAYINYYTTGTTWNPACDLNNDGIMNFADIQLFVHAYNAYHQ